jgi:hypothetical protein
MHALGLRIVAGTALAMMLAAPHCALAQGPKKLAATFEERYPAEQSSTQAAPGQPESRVPGQPESRGEQQNIPASRRAATPKRPRARVVVMPRSFLDAGTDVVPGDRKFLDYALPPTHTPMDVVQNTGGRVGWHNSPLPGPFFPWNY